MHGDDAAFDRAFETSLRHSPCHRASPWPAAGHQHQSCALVIAHLTLAEQHDQRPSVAIAYGMQFGVQAAFGAPDTSGNRPFFEQTCRSPMRLQMGGVDHQPVGFARLARKFGKNLVEHAKPAPPHEPVVDRLMRPVVARCVTPAQAVADHKNDPADYPPVIHPRLSVRKRKKSGSIWRICASESKLNNYRLTPVGSCS